MSLSDAIASALGGNKKPKAEGEIDEVETPEEEIDDTETDDDEVETAEADDEEDQAAVEDDEETAESDDEETKATRSANFSKGFNAALKRTGAILTHASADANPKLAAQLAFGKGYRSLGAKAAIALLKSSGGAKKSGLSDRMQGHKHGLAGDGSSRVSANTPDGQLVDVAGKNFGRNKSRLKLIKNN